MPSDSRTTSRVEQRLTAAGVHLPEVRAQGAYTVATVRDGTVWTAGQLSRIDTGVITGLAQGPDDLPDVRHACRIAALRAIAAVRSVVDLDAVTQVLFVRGFIASTSTFTMHTNALDSASELLLLAFGPELGRHSRSALGVSSLPSGGLAELELVVGV